MAIEAPNSTRRPTLALEAASRATFIVAALLVLVIPWSGTAGVADYEVITDLTPSNSDGLKSLVVDCPTGKQLLGGGARIFGSITGTALTSSGPEGPPDAPTSWFGTAIEAASTSNNWGLRVDAIYAPELALGPAQVLAVALLLVMRWRHRLRSLRYRFRNAWAVAGRPEPPEPPSVA